MRITYDKQADALYIQLSEKPIDGTHSVNDLLNVDLTVDNQIVGIELLRVSWYADDVDTIAEQFDIKKVLDAERDKRNAG